MNAKMYLAGVVGGAFCSSALWFPLTEYLPSTFLKDWGPASAVLGWGLVILACLILLASGAVSARLSGTNNRLGAVVSGAVAGWIAALMSYILVGGAAGAVWGAQPILEFGLKPAANDAQFIQLLVDGITGIHWWTAVVLWGMMLLGLGLGAVGGLLAGPGGGSPNPEMILVYQVTAVSGMLTGALVLIVETAVLSLLGKSVIEASVKGNLTPAYPANAILAFPVITTFLLMLVSLYVWWYFYRRGLAAGQLMNMQVRLSAGVLFGVPILTLIAVLLIYNQSIFYTLYLPFFIITILAGFLILRHVWKNSRSTWESALTFHVGMVSSLLSFLVMAAGAYFGPIPSALGDVLLVVSPMAVWNPSSTGASQVPASMAELVREYYIVYHNTGLLLILAILPVVTLITSGMVLLMMKFFNRRNLPSN